MRTRLLLPIVLLLASSGLAATAKPAPARPTLPPEAEKVARDFLYAFSRNDRDAITAMLPKQLSNLYGPSPFTRMPVLLKPRCDGRTGAIEFQGARTDPGMPDKGVMVLRRTNQDGKTAWRVRQIYWYDALPREAGQIPDKSKTAFDRSEEPKLKRAAMDFLHEWIAGDFRKLDTLVFHWWEVDRDPPKWVKMTGLEFQPPTDSLGGLRLSFQAKLRLLGAISRRVEGSVWLVQEDGVWRVRPLTVAFWF